MRRPSLPAPALRPALVAAGRILAAGALVLGAVVPAAAGGPVPVMPMADPSPVPTATQDPGGGGIPLRPADADPVDARISAMLSARVLDPRIGPRMSALVVDAQSGLTVWQSGADAALMPASTTKLTTAVVAPHARRADAAHDAGGGGPVDQ